MTVKSLLALGLLLASFPAEARWETPEEAGVSTSYAVKMQIEKDGTYETLTDWGITIKLDQYRTYWGTLPFYYNSGLERLELLKAETINGPKREKVAKGSIEDKAERGSDVGFDKTRTLSVAFPHVNVGSTLHVVLKSKNFKAPVPGVFSYAVVANAQLIQPGSSYEFRSKLPLDVEAVDPDHYFIVTQKRDKEFYTVEVKTAKTALFNAVNEKDGEWYKTPPFPRVYISSTRDWKDIGAALSPAYLHELQQPLPAAFAAIRDQAAKLPDDFVARTNFVTSALADEVRYYGDWRSIKGSYTPRSMQTIADTNTADCKEFSLVTAAILNGLGYKTNIALVWRNSNLPWAIPLPTMNAFNHAIVRVEDKSGRIHWIDPTNLASRAQAIRGDIAGRASLILDGANSRLEKTTSLTPEDSVLKRERTLEISLADEEMRGRAVYRFQGSEAERHTALELQSSHRQIEEGFIKDAAAENPVLSGSMAPFDLRSRIVTDQTFEVDYAARFRPDESTAGHAYTLDSIFGDLARLDTRDRVSGFYFRKPQIFEYRDFIEHTNLIGSQAKDCAFDSPWISGERTIHAERGGIAITRKVRVKDYGIGSEEFETPEFKRLRAQVKDCLGRYSVIFEPKKSR